MQSAFGVEHVAKYDRKEYGSPGRLVAGSMFPGVHGALAGKDGHKLKALSSQVVASVPAPVVGGGIATAFGNSKGWYKDQPAKKLKQKKEVSKSLAGKYAAAASKSTDTASRTIAQSRAYKLRALSKPPKKVSKALTMPFPGRRVKPNVTTQMLERQLKPYVMGTRRDVRSGIAASKATAGVPNRTGQKGRVGLDSGLYRRGRLGDAVDAKRSGSGRNIPIENRFRLKAAS